LSQILNSGYWSYHGDTYEGQDRQTLYLLTDGRRDMRILKAAADYMEATFGLTRDQVVDALLGMGFVIYETLLPGPRDEYGLYAGRDERRTP
jgi:hypothetical protein